MSEANESPQPLEEEAAFKKLQEKYSFLQNVKFDDLLKAGETEQGNLEGVPYKGEFSNLGEMMGAYFDNKKAAITAKVYRNAQGHITAIVVGECLDLNDGQIFGSVGETDQCEEVSVSELKELVGDRKEQVQKTRVNISKSGQGGFRQWVAERFFAPRARTTMQASRLGRLEAESTILTTAVKKADALVRACTQEAHDLACELDGIASRGALEKAVEAASEGMKAFRNAAIDVTDPQVPQTNSGPGKGRQR